MHKLFCILVINIVVGNSFLDNYLRDGDVNIDDLIDEKYEAEAQLDKQAAIDDTLKTIIHVRTKEAGYPLEAHSVVTEDGYVLTVHRVPNGPSNAGVKNKPVVLFQHGLLSCSYHWLILGPSKGMVYILADAGYDVWMGNARGNSYSKNHARLSPRNAAFWDFSWNEIGYYDLPAMINYILKNTNQDALNYVGHSQGTTSFFVMASSRPEYNQKIKAMHALAPVAYMSNMKQPFFRTFGPLGGQLGFVRQLLGGFEFLPSTKLVTAIASIICRDDSILQGICANILFMICGFSPETLNTVSATITPEIIENLKGVIIIASTGAETVEKFCLFQTLLAEIMKTTPSGASVNQIIHYAQGISSGKFRRFDYGIFKNLVKYIGFEPPEYNLGKITAPVHLYYAKNDWLASVKDVQILASKLPNVVYNKQVPHNTFNHIDFLWGVCVDGLVYNDLLTNIKKYT